MNNKPIQLVVEDIKNNIADIINDANIPMCCITPVIRDIYEQCKIIENKEYLLAKDNYENSKHTITNNTETGQ